MSAHHFIFELIVFLTWGGGLFFSPGTWISAQETELVFCPRMQPNPDTDQMRRNQIYFSGVIFKNKPAPLLPMCLLGWNMDGVICIASCSPSVGPSHHMLHTQHSFALQRNAQKVSILHLVSLLPSSSIAAVGRRERTTPLVCMMDL